jgi:hypothetical protein
MTMGLWAVSGRRQSYTEMMRAHRFGELAHPQAREPLADGLFA